MRGAGRWLGFHELQNWHRQHCHSRKELARGLSCFLLP